MLTGAVDLLNEVATQKITGEEEVFSHTDLYDFRANIEGAEKIFSLFKPLIEKKMPSWLKPWKQSSKMSMIYWTNTWLMKQITSLTQI